MGKKLKQKIFVIKKVKHQRIWTKEEDKKLLLLTSKYKEKGWRKIASHFHKKTSLQCFSRYKRIKPGIIRGSWTKEEDSKILQMISRYGKLWSKLSKELKTRNGKQIRDRYLNVLNPHLNKKKFSQKENEIIKSLFVKNGPKWAMIAKSLSNRTADMVKNHFYSFIKKNILKEAKDKEDKPVNQSEFSSSLPILNNTALPHFDSNFNNKNEYSIESFHCLNEDHELDNTASDIIMFKDKKEEANNFSIFDDNYSYTFESWGLQI